MPNLRRLLVLCLLVGIVWVSWENGSGQAKEIEVKLLEIKGNRKIDTATITSKIKTREGDPFSVERLREDLKAVYQMGYFDDVRLESEGFEGGVKLTFIVSEKPIVEDRIFLGNTRLSSDKLKEKVPFRTRVFLDQNEVNEAAEKIRKAYQDEGFYGAEVLPVIRTISPEKVLVEFAIKEGERAYIRNLRFEGAEHFSARKLKKAIESSEYFWLTSWLTDSGTYKKEEVRADLERIRESYLNQGFLQVQVGSPRVTLSPDRKWFDIAFPVVEGVSFRISRIGFSGNRLYDDAKLREVLGSKEGETFNRDQIRKDILAIVDLYGQKGYAFANVVPQLSPDPSTQTVAVSFEVSEGDLVRVRQINIFGNEKTREKVIRREIRIDEQEILDTVALKRSFQRLNNLNFFENVEIVPKEVERGWVDLDVRVKEKPTGTFSIGGGYSSVDRLIGLVQIEQGNLFGRGQLLRLKTELGARRQNYTLTFREPYLFDKEISGTVDVFNQLQTFSTYQEKRLGGDFILGKSFTEYVSGSVSYTLENLKIIDAAPGSSRLILDQQDRGETLTSSVGLSLARDTRDFFFDPKEGSRNSISFELAGTFLGGDNSYYRVIGDSSRYFPAFWDTVFSVHARAGYAHGLSGRVLPLGERFFVGGINTVRGIRFGKAGPVDLVGEILGGNKELIFNLEYLFPILPEARIKGVLFFDAGRGFDDHEAIRIRELRTGAGAGLRWISPVGPLRLEFGFNLDPSPGEPSWFPEFSIGSLF
jgi:outer membrane protein insertion porin family